MEQIAITATIIGGAVGGTFWFLKFLVERSVRQVDERLHDMSARLERGHDRVQEIAERVAVLRETTDTTRRDLNNAFNKIREMENRND